MYRDVVVVADDMGYAHERDEGIVHAYQHGIITQSSVRQQHTSHAYT